MAGLLVVLVADLQLSFDVRVLFDQGLHLGRQTGPHLGRNRQLQDSCGIGLEERGEHFLTLGGHAGQFSLKLRPLARLGLLKTGMQGMQ